MSSGSYSLPLIFAIGKSSWLAHSEFSCVRQMLHTYTACKEQHVDSLSICFTFIFGGPPTPTSAPIAVASLRVRALIGTTASVCLLKEVVFRHLSAFLKQDLVTLQIVTASSVKVFGRVYLSVTHDGVTVYQCFYIVHNRTDQPILFVIFCLVLMLSYIIS